MLPAMFVLAGCDTVSYFYRKSKKAILQQVLKQEVLVVELVLDLKQIWKDFPKYLSRYVFIF